MRSWSGRRARWIRTFALVTATGSGLAGLSACGGDARDIEVGTVERRAVDEVVEAAGSVLARTQVSLRAPAAGTVDTLRVSSGDEVKKGDVLLTLSSPAAEDSLAAAEAAAAEVGSEPAQMPSGGGAAAGEATRAAEEAFANAEAAARALPEGPGREAALAQSTSARAAFAAAQAQAQAAIDRFTVGLGSLSEALASISAAGRIQAQAAVTAARRTVEALTIRAPADGVVTLGSGSGGSGGPSALLGGLPPEAAALLGGSTGAGAAESSAGSGPVGVGAPVEAGGLLATVIDDSELTLRAEVDETDILAVTEGVPAEVELDAVPGATYPAAVRFVDLAPTTSARGGVTYAVTLSLQPGRLPSGAEAPRPRPGMSAIVGLKVAEAGDATSVPASALVRDGDKDTVWRVENGKVVRREVTLGAEGEEFVQILSGLELGDRVVVRGADEVREGDEI